MGMERKKKLSEMLYGDTRVGKMQETAQRESQRKLKGIHQSTLMLDTESIKLETDNGLPIGVAQIRNADGTYTLGFDPGAGLNTTGDATSLIRKHTVDPYMHQYLEAAAARKSYTGTNLKFIGANYLKQSISMPSGWAYSADPWKDFADTWKNWYVNMPRGYGKTTALSKFEKSMSAIGRQAEETGKGLEELRKANDAWEAKLKAANEEARLAVSEEKVYAFMEQNFLPYDYARKLLEEAYKDSLLNEGKQDDTAQPTA